MRGILVGLALLLALVTFWWAWLVVEKPSAPTPDAAAVTIPSDSTDFDLLQLHANGEIDLNGTPLPAFSTDHYLWKDTQSCARPLLKELSATSQRHSVLKLRVDEAAMVGWYLRLFDVASSVVSFPSQPDDPNQLWQKMILEIGADSHSVPNLQDVLQYPMVRMDLRGGPEYRFEIHPQTLDISGLLQSQRTGFAVEINCPEDWTVKKGREMAKQVFGPQSEIGLMQRLSLSDFAQADDHD